MSLIRRKRFTVVEPMNHWRVRDGRIYRDHIVRLLDGTLTVWCILDEGE